MRNKPVDVCLILDATNAMQSLYYSVIKNFHNLVNELNSNFQHADFKYGAIVLRDPVDWVQPPPLDAEIERQINECERNAREELKNKLIEKHLWDEEFEELKEEYQRHIDRDEYPINQNAAIDFEDNYEILVNELKKVECSGGNDAPEDWNGAIRCALNMSWRDGSKKCVILISDANAHGKLFCGFDNHNEEENELINAVETLADNHFYFIGINIKKGEDEGCQKTLQEMKQIYNNHSGINFVIEEFRPIYDIDLYGEDEWPRDVSDSFMQTIQRSITSLGNLDI